MTMQLDHIFILTQPDAPEAERLRALGLREGSANTHPGQGTANRRFFLDNITIELLFVSDTTEAANGSGKRLGILTRSRDKNASPFGILVRAIDVKTTPAFPNWKYFADYFPDDWCFYVGENSDNLIEPLCICMPLSLPEPQAVPTQYANAKWHLTDLTVQVPLKVLSATLSEFAQIENLTVKSGDSHRITMKFNDGAEKSSVDLMPDLPLTLEW